MRPLIGKIMTHVDFIGIWIGRGCQRNEFLIAPPNGCQNAFSDRAGLIEHVGNRPAEMAVGFARKFCGQWKEIFGDQGFEMGRTFGRVGFCCKPLTPPRDAQIEHKLLAQRLNAGPLGTGGPGRFIESFTRPRQQRFHGAAHDRANFSDHGI